MAGMTRVAVLFLIWLLCIVCALYSLVRMLFAMFTAPAKAWMIAKGFDRTGNAATNGTDEEYISTRAARARKEGRRWGCILCRLLAKVDPPDHCAKYEPKQPASAGSSFPDPA